MISGMFARMPARTPTVGLLAFVICISFPTLGLSGAAAKPKTVLQQARTAVKARKLPEAVTAYEQVIADPSRDAAKYKADALYELLLLRVSADPAVRDLQRGAAAVEGLRAFPAYPRVQEIAVIAALLQEAERRVADADKRIKELQEQGDKRLAEASTRAAAQAARADDLAKQLAGAKQGDESPKLRQESAALRADNRNLRDQLARTQAELQKKDEALKKVAGSLIRPR
jgi:hypothetical protein